jgi:hypothetical protein
MDSVMAAVVTREIFHLFNDAVETTEATQHLVTWKIICCRKSQRTCA